MKIIIEADNEGVVKGLEIKDGPCTLDNMISVLFSILDRVTKHSLEDASQDLKDYLYEHFNALFDLFLRNVFPVPPDGYFDLSDAALVYAQDKIIEEAEKKGITFKEALKKYENQAEVYLDQKRRGIS